MHFQVLAPSSSFSHLHKKSIETEVFVIALVESSHGISHRYLCAWNQTQIKNTYRRFSKMSWEWSSSLSIPVTQKNTFQLDCLPAQLSLKQKGDNIQKCTFQCVNELLS